MSSNENAQMDLRRTIPGLDSEGKTEQPEVICACHGKMCDECLDKYGIEK